MLRSCSLKNISSCRCYARTRFCTVFKCRKVATCSQHSFSLKISLVPCLETRSPDRLQAQRCVTVC